MVDDDDFYSGAIGIDLGTTYSCVAVAKNNRVEIITNDHSNRSTPSYVGFTKSGILVGDSAKNQCHINPKNTIFDAKRLIGRSINDDIVKEDREYWPFEIAEKDQKIVFKVKHRAVDTYFTPEEISSFILTYLKEMAEKYLGKKVKDVVIAVPAFFNNSQRQATMDAGALSELNVISILSEPTAAAIAYGIDNSSLNKRNVLVFDLGGGTFDVSILSIESENFEVLSIAGDSHLGGNDFDQRLVNHFIGEFFDMHSVDISRAYVSVSRLRAKSEKAKRALSSTRHTNLDIDLLYDGLHFQSAITREKFEELCDASFKKTLVYLEEALVNANLGKRDIDDVVMVGGSSRILKIQELVRNYFNGRNIRNSLNPDEAVAYGAAIHAAALSSFSKKFKELVLVERTSRSLGIETSGETIAIIVPRNSQIPTTQTETFTTTTDYQTEVRIEIFEGESEHSRSNNRIGLFILQGVSSALRGIPKIDVTFSIDANRILTVKAVDRVTGLSNHIEVNYEVKRLKQSEIKDLVLKNRFDA